MAAKEGGEDTKAALSKEVRSCSANTASLPENHHSTSFSGN